MASQTHIEGLEELERLFNNLGENFPKSKIRKAAKKGIKQPLKDAIKEAPELHGDLKRGIVAVEEAKWKSIKKLKKSVFQVYFNKAYNEIFQKKNSRGQITAYYPVSQEYGWKLRNGTKEPGKEFIKKAVESNTNSSLKTVVDSLTSDINKIMERG